MLEWEERRKLVKIAKQYYFEGLTQAEIARKNGVSRPIISKALNSAKIEGIVDIYIKDETVLTVELEEKLEKRFGLKEAIVISSSHYSNDMLNRQLGKTAAAYISKSLKNDKTHKLGISWGNTLLSFVEEYPYERRNNIHIVPIIGGMGHQLVHLHSNQLANKLAQKMNTSCSYLYAPAMVENSELRERLRDTKEISHVLEEARTVDVAVVGIGNPSKESTLVEMGYLGEQDLTSLRNGGAVGNIGSSFFDMDGNEIDHPLNKQFIGLTAKEIKEVPEVIGIAEGPHKIDSMIATLNGGYLSKLITDEKTADAILSKK